MGVCRVVRGYKEPILSYMGLYGGHIELYERIWGSYMGLYGGTWGYMGTHGVSVEVIWGYGGLYGVMWG